MADLIATTAVELAKVFSPLTVALDDAEEFSLFLRRFGIRFQSGLLTDALGDLASLRDGVLAIATAAHTAAEDGFAFADIVPLFESARPLFATIGNLSSMLSGVLPDGMTPEAFAQSLATLPDELLDLLLADYLNQRTPIAAQLLNLLDVYRPRMIPAIGDPASRGLAYVRHDFDWSRIGMLFDNPESWARAAYDWGIDLDTDKLIWRLARVIELIGGVVHIEEMTVFEVAAFLPDWPTPNLPPTMARAPLVRKQVFAENGSLDAAASGEAGVALFPVAGKSPPGSLTDKGIATGPYLEGEAGASIDFGGGWSASVNGSLGAVGGIVFALRPSGVEIKTGIDAAAFDGAFTMELTKRPVAGAASMIFVGREGGSRVEATSFTAALGGAFSNTGTDLFAAAGIEDLRAVIDVSSDGFLGMLLSAPMDIEAGNVLAGWRAGRGIYFEGGTSLSVTIPVDKTIGPFKLYKIGVDLDWSSPALTSTITADARLGPLYAFVEGLGLVLTLVPNPNGSLGKHDLAFALKLPTGYAVALEAPGIEGGGFLSVLDNEYRGALALKFQTFGFSAFAILNTKLPGGERGFSFVASIFGDFVVPLGFGFFLTGLGGIIGLNRTVNTQSLRDVLYAGSLDSILFPVDPIGNAATILANMAAIFPAREGQHVFGPVARIAFGQPPLIEGKLGVVIEAGREVRLLILGALSSQLPTKDAPLISLQLSFFGEIDPATGTISFDATLQNSRVLIYAVSGDIAVRSGWAPRIEHVISFGGLHPQYPRPANLPDLRRLGISFGTNNPRLTLTSYQALTLNSLQFGSRAEFYAKGPHIAFVGDLAAEGNAFFDALIYFNPFAFDVALGGSLSLLVDGDVAMNLGFALRLTGPNVFVIDGRVWATVFGIDVGFDVHHSWGSARSVPAVTADPVAILTNALSQDARLEPVASSAFADGVRFAGQPKGDDKHPLPPAGGARFVQRALPLGVTIEKIGEARIVGAVTRLDLGVSAGGAAAETQPATLDFVRGHFWALSEGERLRSTAFEPHKAGFEIAAAGDIVIDQTRAIEGDYEYEIILLADDEAAAPSISAAPVKSAVMEQWIAGHHRDATAPLSSALDIGKRADSIAVVASSFVSVMPSRPVDAPSPTFTSFNEARLAALADDGPLAVNPVVASYVAAARI